MKNVVILIAVFSLFFLIFLSRRVRQKGKIFWEFALEKARIGYEKIKSGVKIISVNSRLVDIVSADMLTYARFIISLVLWYYILRTNWQGHLLHILALDIIAYLTDMFDGAIAELKGTKSALGSWIDNIGDKLLAFPNLYFLVKLQNAWSLAIWIFAFDLILIALRIYTATRHLRIEANYLGKAKLFFQGFGFCFVVSSLPLIAPVGKIILVASVFLSAGSLITHILKNYRTLLNLQTKPGS